MATVKKGSKAAKAKMAKVRAAKKLTSKVNELKRKQLRKSGRDYQTSVKLTNSGGYLYPYNRAVDERKKAKRPGKRVTDWGTTYYERRVNRSDAKGSLTGIAGIKNDVLSQINDLNRKIEKYTEMKNTYSKMSKNKNIAIEDRKHYKYMENLASKNTNSFKRQITSLKKLI